jgi:hypothetical protein
VKPVEEIAPVQRNRVGPTLIVQGAMKFGYIGPHEIRGQAHRVGRGDDRRVSERPA